MSDFREQALHYHSHPVPGKISIELTKPAETVQDLALAYSPGVAEPVREIAADPANAYKYTGKGNMVAVITNGTAILGLGNLGPLASKPVMEGKALLFKRFAGLDSIDIEVKHKTTEDFINRMVKTYGENKFDFTSHINLITNTLLGVSLMFELPVIIYFLT